VADQGAQVVIAIDRQDHRLAEARSAIPLLVIPLVTCPPLVQPFVLDFVAYRLFQ
jgi:threonine dehydrogenase-like Zn-dependent dehydrogenase